MLAFDTFQVSRNGKKVQDSFEYSENNSSENNPMSTQEDYFNSESEARILFHEDVNEQVKSYNATLTK